MDVTAFHYGSYPRIGDSRELQRLRAATEAFQRGDIGEAELTGTRNEVIREVMAEQARAGLDAVSDGQVRWHDAVSHRMTRLKGVSAGGLLRYFDTNTYFRQPVVTGVPEGGSVAEAGAMLASEVKYARAIGSRPVAIALLGPLTLSRLCLAREGSLKAPGALFGALVPIVAEEVGQVAEAGPGTIVIEEPSLLKDPAAFADLADAMEVIAARKGATRLLFFASFGDAAPLYERLQRLPVDGLLLDLTYSPALSVKVEADGSRLPLALGLVDARNTRLERPPAVAKAAERLLRRAGPGSHALVASNGIEYLPRERAGQKLAVLARARDLLAGHPGEEPRGKPARPRRRPARPRRRPGRTRKARVPAGRRKPSARKRERS
jgi:5-methyltetrahydropteroyltriglutamate--homocysteine methyltransferase